MRKVFPLLLLIALINVSCTQSEKKEEAKKDAAKTEATTADKQENGTGKKVVARVNGKPIYEEDLQGRPLRMVINEEILYQEGLKKGLDKRFQGEIDVYKKRIIAETVKRELLIGLPKAKEIEVTNEQIKNYYEKHPDKYTFISVKEISLPDKSTAEEVRKKLLAGEDPVKIKSDLGEKVAAHQRSGRLLVEHAGIPPVRDMRSVEIANALPVAEVDGLTVGQGAGQAVGCIVQRDQATGLSVRSFGLRRDRKPFVQRAALVGLEMAEANPAQALDRGQPADGVTDERKHAPETGVEQ